MSKVCLISIDGWGFSVPGNGNAAEAADTKVMDELCGGVLMPPVNPNATTDREKQEHKQLHEAASKGLVSSSSSSVCVAIDASGLAVGLPSGVMGNSEVGHLTMGAGQANYQDLVRINQCLEKAGDGPMTRANDVLASVLRHQSLTGPSATGRLHLMGLVSDGGVHSHIDHLKALLTAAKAEDVGHTYVHFFADGRDTPPRSSPKYLRQLLDHCSQTGYGQLATVQGRYYAMDRDKRWERTQLAYEALCAGVGERVSGGASAIISAVEARHGAGETDEFLRPLIVADGDSGSVRAGDTVLFIDFRADRMRQIVECFAADHDGKDGLPFEVPATVSRPLGVRLATMTQYRSDLAHLPTLFPPQTMVNTLAEWLSRHNRKQLHVAETEKYAHVTFFFNGGVEKQYEGEDRVLIPSPKVATYDLQPAMSVDAVADALCKGITDSKHEFVMCNMAPPDMVGHTGVYEATVKACAATDAAIGRVRAACQAAGYALVVTSDHGNCERMFDANGKPYTAHTINLVPLCVAPAPNAGPVQLADDVVSGKRVATLADVAPTVLALMGLDCPPEMTGKSVISADSGAAAEPASKKSKK